MVLLTRHRHFDKRISDVFNCRMDQAQRQAREEVSELSKIQQLRKAKGWSRSELARQARMDAGDISKIERGILVPYPGQVMKIAWALGVRAIDIANDINERNTNV